MFFCGSKININAQKEISWGYKGYDFVAGYHLQKYHTLELGIAYAARGDELAGVAYGNFHLTTEMVLRNRERNLYGIKSGFAFAFVFFDLCGQVGYYSDLNGNTCFTIRPEVGLSWLGLVNLNIGKNFNLTKDSDLGLNSYTLNLRFMIGQITKPIDVLP